VILLIQSAYLLKKVLEKSKNFQLLTINFQLFLIFAPEKALF